MTPLDWMVSLILAVNTETRMNIQGFFNEVQYINGWNYDALQQSSCHIHKKMCWAFEFPGNNIARRQIT